MIHITRSRLHLLHGAAPPEQRAFLYLHRSQLNSRKFPGIYLTFELIEHTLLLPSCDSRRSRRPGLLPRVVHLM
jgi:hypothetical protein